MSTRKPSSQDQPPKKERDAEEELAFQARKIPKQPHGYDSVDAAIAAMNSCMTKGFW